MDGDQTKAVEFSQGGQPGGEASPPEPQSAAQPKYLTMEEAQHLAQEAEERAFRRAQGLYDKRSEGIEKRVQTALEGLGNTLTALKANGLEITPEVEARLRAGELERALTAPSASPPSTEPGPAQDPGQEPDEEPGDPITAEAWTMMREAGVTIEPGDPEAKTLDNSSGYRFLKSVEAAIEAKRARLGGSPPGEATPSQPPTPPVAPTNLGGIGRHEPNPIANVTDPATLLAMAFKSGGK